MFDKIKQVMQKTMDTLAPDPSLHEDFEYHWKRFMQHYMDLTFEDKIPIEQTYFPDCLDRLKDILINEDRMLASNGCTLEVGSCMVYLFQHNLLDMLITVAIVDKPPGIKLCVLRFFSKILINLKELNIAHSAVYIPLIKLMNACDGLLHAVYETSEVEFLLNLNAVLCKQPAVAMLFISEESIKSTIKTAKESENLNYFGILDLVLTYVDSADSKVRVKACQCILLLCSMKDDFIAKLIMNNFKLNHFLIGRLTTLFYEISQGNCDQFKRITANWTLDMPINFQAQNNADWEGVVFLNWLDFINQLTLESHVLIKYSLNESLRVSFLEEFFNVKSLSYPKTVAVLYKYYRTITSVVLLNGFQEWLIAKGNHPDIPDLITNPILQILIDNCVSQNEFLAVTCLEFFVEILEKCDERILSYLIFCYLNDRSYFDITAYASSWSDEEDERQKYSSSSENLSFSRTIAPASIDRIIQCFTDIIPDEISTQNSEDIQYVQDQYERIVHYCSQFKWPTEATSDPERMSNDSNPEADIPNKIFYEGPFLQMIFKKLKNIVPLDYTQTSLLITIILKLTLLPHPFLHEYLLNPLLPLRKDVQSLHSVLQGVVNEVWARVQIIINCRDELLIAKDRLFKGKKHKNTKNEIDKYLESFILLEDLSNKLAVTAYVKYTYFH